MILIACFKSFLNKTMCLFCELQTHEPKLLNETSQISGWCPGDSVHPLYTVYGKNNPSSNEIWKLKSSQWMRCRHKWLESNIQFKKTPSGLSRTNTGCVTVSHYLFNSILGLWYSTGKMCTLFESLHQNYQGQKTKQSNCHKLYSLYPSLI